MEAEALKQPVKKGPVGLPTAPAPCYSKGTAGPQRASPCRRVAGNYPRCKMSKVNGTKRGGKSTGVKPQPKKAEAPQVTDEMESRYQEYLKDATNQPMDLMEWAAVLWPMIQEFQPYPALLGPAPAGGLPVITITAGGN